MGQSFLIIFIFHNFSVLIVYPLKIQVVLINCIEHQLNLLQELPFDYSLLMPSSVRTF